MLQDRVGQELARYVVRTTSWLTLLHRRHSNIINDHVLDTIDRNRARLEIHICLTRAEERRYIMSASAAMTDDLTEYNAHMWCLNETGGRSLIPVAQQYRLMFTCEGPMLPALESLSQGRICCVCPKLCDCPKRKAWVELFLMGETLGVRSLEVYYQRHPRAGGVILRQAGRNDLWCVRCRIPWRDHSGQASRYNPIS